MREWFFPTAFSHWGDEERAAIDRVMTSGRFTQGEEVAAFEAEVAAFHGRAHGVMVNSGSSANLIAVSALRHLGLIKAGDKAIVPALAWSTTYAPLVEHGIDLVLVDCDETWNADPYSMRDPGDVKLVVACSILGIPADLPAWQNAAGVFGAPLIEDNCESLGASIISGLVTVGAQPHGSFGRACGSFGLMSTSSFFYSHQISAIEGGMVLTDDDECDDVLRMLRAHGWTRDQRMPLVTPVRFEDEYDFQVFGYNVRGLELHAAVAREQLKKLPGFVKARRANAEMFDRLVMDDGLPVILPVPNGETSPFGLHFMVKDGETRNRAARALRAAGIDCRPPTGGSFTKHAYGKAWANQPTPRADLIHDTGMFLGNAPFDIGDKIARAVEIMRGIL